MDKPSQCDDNTSKKSLGEQCIPDQSNRAETASLNRSTPVWTKHPVWSPRRASVASCQYQQQHLFASNYVSERQIQFLDSSRGASRQQLQIQQLMRQRQKQLRRATRKLATTHCEFFKVKQDAAYGGSEATLVAADGERCATVEAAFALRDRQQQPASRNKSRESIDGSTRTSLSDDGSSGGTKADRLADSLRSVRADKQQSDSTNKNFPNYDNGDDAGVANDGDDDAARSLDDVQDERGPEKSLQGNKSARIEAHVEDSATSSRASGSKQFKRLTCTANVVDPPSHSSLQLASRNNSSTCFSESKAIAAMPLRLSQEASYLHSSKPAALEEMRRLQEQRKYLILSMALKRIIAHRDLAMRKLAVDESLLNRATDQQDSADYVDCGRKSRSYSFGVAKSPLLTCSSGSGTANSNDTTKAPTITTTLVKPTTNASSRRGVAAATDVLFSNEAIAALDDVTRYQSIQLSKVAPSLDADSNLLSTCQRTTTTENSLEEPVPRVTQRKLAISATRRKSADQKRIAADCKHLLIPPPLPASEVSNNMSNFYEGSVMRDKTSLESGSEIRTDVDDDDEQHWRDFHSPTNTSDQISEADSDCELASPRDEWQDHTCGQYDNNDLAKQYRDIKSALSVMSENPIPNRKGRGFRDVDLESIIIESWLDDNPAFTYDYFMRKASRKMVDDWLIGHAKINKSNLSSQMDFRSLNASRPGSQISLNGLRGQPLWPTSESPNEPRSASGGSGCWPNSIPAGLRPARSNSQSSGTSRGGRKTMTPVRKISATDFESRSGSGLLRPMLSTTPDGCQTFLSLHPSTTNLKWSTSTNIYPDNNRKPLLTRRTTDSKQEQLEVTVPNIQSNNNNNMREYSTVFHTNKQNYTDCKEPAQVGSEKQTSIEIDNDELSHTQAEMKLIFELVKNIYDDLDIQTLLYKILKNITVLINADKSSLFLVRGEPGSSKRSLVSQLFNVDQDSVDEPWLDKGTCVEIPWGAGLVGHVAISGEFLNIEDCYNDPRFTDVVDQRTGYVTKHMLCAPIFDKSNEIVGVAQVINKRNGLPFNQTDEVQFKRYLQFCGIGLRNAQSYEQCQLENRRNQVLLDLARMVFEEQSTLEQTVYRIMVHIQSLLECQRCQVLLIDDGTDELEQQQMFTRNSPLSTRTTSVQTNQDDLSLKAAKGSRKNSDASSHSSQLLEIPVDSNLSPRLFSLVFDMECDGHDPVMHRRSENEKDHLDGSTQVGNRKFPINIGITGYVAMTGETLNIVDAHQHERFDPSVDEGSDFKHKSILCMPIRNGQRQIIGVTQLINKTNERSFNKNDEDLFEAFAIFFGLGIHNTLMYERVVKISAKQSVTFEVLSYHATAPLEEAKKLNHEQVPSSFALNLASLKFNDFSLDDQYMLKSCLRFFLDLDLIRRFQIDELVFCNWILSVQKNYRTVTYHPVVGGNGFKASPVRYHNWRHAFNVSQMMFAILVNTQISQPLGELETLALLIACLCHDLDHRGTNNSFQIKSASPLAELYSTSTMEHHHFDQCVMILNGHGNQILANLSPAEYSRVIMLLKEAILATDLANYFQKRDLFFQLVNSNKFDWRNDADHRSLLRCMLMTACDVAAITKPWKVQKIVADLVMSEFYQQGDIERNELNIEPIDMMNRDKQSKLPEMQISFIDTICAPIYTSFARLFPASLRPLLDGCLKNRVLWSEMVGEGSTAIKQLDPITSNQSCGLSDNEDLIDTVRDVDGRMQSTSSTNLDNTCQFDSLHTARDDLKAMNFVTKLPFVASDEVLSPTRKFFVQKLTKRRGSY